MAENDNLQEKVARLKKSRARSFYKNLIIICLIATLLAVGAIWLGIKNVFFFMFLALLPTILSSMWDKKPGRFASKTVAAFNIAGIFPYIMAISSSGSPDSTAIHIFNNPQSWMLVYGFALFGWSTVLLIPKITLIYLEIRSKYLIKKMEEFQKELIDEWGEELKNNER